MVNLKGLKVVLGKWPTFPIVKETGQKREKNAYKVRKRRN
jgi:hypothetical protein